MSDTRTVGLARKLSTFDAVLIGVGSMVGAGIFAAFTPAAAVAGSGLLIGLLIAAGVAFCNATSSAQLAAQYPSSGGTYLYGREQLGAWPGFLAGWGFLIGKTASSAAMALTFAAYAVPPAWQRPAAVVAVLGLALANCFGVTRTAQLTKLIVISVLAILVLAIGLVWTSGAARPVQLPGNGFFASGWYGILQSAGLLFFAFAGYARIATLGEEVRRPKRSIPRAIVIALACTAALYGVVAVTLLAVLTPSGVAGTPAPLLRAVEISGADWALPLLRLGAALAALGALLALLAGLGRTTLAMARERDLPQWLSAVHPRYQVPRRAELVLAAAICLIVVFADVRNAIGFSSFGVLVYYLVANAAAFRQDSVHRRYPKAIQVLGGLACLILVGTLPWPAVVVGLGVFAVGGGYRLIRLRLSRPAR